MKIKVVLNGPRILVFKEINGLDLGWLEFKWEDFQKPALEFELIGPPNQIRKFEEDFN